MVPLAQKYLPQSVKEIIGQEEAMKQLVPFVLNYPNQKKKAVLLFGPTGTGKTSSAYAIANEMGLEIFELNASDSRNKEQIHQKLGAALKQQSLFGGGKLILVDEIDGLAGNKDRGGISEIVSLIQKSTYPIILTLANPYENKFSSLRSKTVMIEFLPIDAKTMAEHLSHICKKEKLAIPDDVLKTVARRSGGDMRAALNDIEILSALDTVTKESLDALGMREKEETIITALLKIFKSTDPKIAITAFDSVAEDLDEQLLWIDENLPKEYTKKEDLARAYEYISKADLFNRRIRRWQHWRFLVYINAFLTAGIAVSKDEKYEGFTPYKPTGRILKMWWAKQKAMKKKSIAGKIAAITHTSTREMIKSMPYFRMMFRDKGLSEKLSSELKLDEEEIEWMRK